MDTLCWPIEPDFTSFEAIFTHDSYMGTIGQEGSFSSELIPSV